MTRTKLAALLLSSVALVIGGASAAKSQSYRLNDASTEAGKPGTISATITGTRTAKSYVTIFLGAPTDSAVPGKDFQIVARAFEVLPTDTKISLDVPTFDPGATSSKQATAKLVVNRGGKLLDGTAYLTIKPKAVVPPTPIPCDDGSTVIPPATCPTPPTPPAGDIPAIDLGGLKPISSPFDPMLATVQLTTTVPSAAPDVLGAIRLTCGSAGFGRFDPKVYPGDHTGKSHLHEFYGNVSITPDSTYEGVRTAPASVGRSTCNYGPYTAQRSGYWQPAMMEGDRAIPSDYTTLYYKRRPLSDPVVSAKPGTPITPLTPNDQKFTIGKGVDLPHGLFFIFGYDMLTGTPSTGAVRFLVVEPDAQGNPDRGPQTEFKTLADAAKSGKMYPGSTLWIRGSSPSCWNGSLVDSANHRSHMAYPGYGSWGYLRCPDTHPYVITEISLITAYRVRSGDQPLLWHLSSDDMHPELPAGSTWHGDIWPMWDPTVKAIGERGCNDQLLNCSAGRLSQTIGLKNAANPMYPDANGNLVGSWLVPDQYRKVQIGPEGNDRIIGPKYN